MGILMQLAAFLSSFIRAPLMDTLGLQATTRLHDWCDVAASLNSAFAPWKEMMWLNAGFSLFQCGGMSIERCLQQESALLGLGQGELAAAEANRQFLPSLVMPHFFTTVYNRCSRFSPAVPFCLAAALSVASAEVATPWAFRRLSPSVLANAQPNL